MRLGEDSYFYNIRQWLLNRKARKRFEFFGKNAEFRPGAYAAYTENISIGKGVVIRPGCRLFADDTTFIIIEDNVLLGHGVHLYTNNHSYKLDIPIFLQGYEKQENVILESGCWIGANSVILPGVTVGENAVVGAGSVVTKNVPNGEVWGGNPARCLKRSTENVKRQEIISDSASKDRLYRRKKKEHSTV
jgi:acetyltransferase-like isoleucine patch superfamily enzyme